jgi:hypothetical protein
VEHRASTKSFQALRSPAIPLTSFCDLPVFLISSSAVLRHVLFGLPLLLYPWGLQYNAVFSVAPASLCNVYPIQFYFLLFIRISVGFCLVITLQMDTLYSTDYISQAKKTHLQFAANIQDCLAGWEYVDLGTYKKYHV